MSAGAWAETEALVGPGRRAAAPCPSCRQTVHVEGIMFRDDDDEVLVTCHWCEAEYVVRRRTALVGYELAARGGDDFPTLDDVIDYRRRRLIGQLDALPGHDPDAARAGAERLLLEYLGDEKIAAAFRRAVREEA